MQKSIKSFIRGTSIKIIVKLNINTASTAKITIEDPSELAKVSSVNMTKDANKYYSYVWQSSTTDVWGIYVITITITNGSYTSIAQKTFNLLEEE